MIKSKNNPFARLIFNNYIDRLLKKNFSNFYLCNEYPTLKLNESVLITPNHFSWWDGFLIDYVVRMETNLDLRIMMLEEQLKKYWFFKYVGAFSITPNKPFAIKDSINYTTKLLREKNNALIIYPQGEIEPFGKRPLSLKKGISLMLKNPNNITVIPAAFDIAFSEQKLPSIFLRFGDPLSAKIILNDFKTFENAFYSNLNLLSDAVVNRNFIKDYFNQ
jgi:1-acyl-sn-glycerol-3-phosphate acyltransferase